MSDELLLSKVSGESAWMLLEQVGEEWQTLALIPDGKAAARFCKLFQRAGSTVEGECVRLRVALPQKLIDDLKEGNAPQGEPQP
jgi:hypothetical protein